MLRVLAAASSRSCMFYLLPLNRARSSVYACVVCLPTVPEKPCEFSIFFRHLTTGSIAYIRSPCLTPLSIGRGRQMPSPVFMAQNIRIYVSD